MRLRPILLASILSIATPSLASDEPTASIDAALGTLKDGNARFAAGESTFPHLDQARRCETTEGGQHPIAAILSCADSRVPPELVFDAGLGDVFVVRVMGNVAGGDEVGTLEYGVTQLGTPLIVVMGHGKCDAVAGVVRHADVGPAVAKLVAPITPAVDEARAQNPNAGEAKLIALATRANVHRAMRDVVAQSSAIRSLVDAGKVRVVGAVYDVHNGTIEWLADAPEPVAGKSAEDNAKTVSHHASGPVSASHGDAKPQASGHGELMHETIPPAHETPSVREKVEKHESHATPEPTAAHAKPEAYEASPAHEASSAHEASPAHEPGAEPEAKSLVARQGLLVPAAFMAAGSALSGTIVYALKSRPKLSPVPHVEPAPAAH